MAVREMYGLAAGGEAEGGKEEGRGAEGERSGNDGNRKEKLKSLEQKTASDPLLRWGPVRRFPLF